MGLFIRPYGLARFTDVLPWLSYVVIADVQNVQSLAELGIVFLLFMIGLELSVSLLWSMKRLVFGLGGAQVILSSIIIAAVAILFDNTLPVSVILGAGFALSSTAAMPLTEKAEEQLNELMGDLDGLLDETNVK